MNARPIRLALVTLLVVAGMLPAAAQPMPISPAPGEIIVTGTPLILVQVGNDTQRADVTAFLNDGYEVTGDDEGWTLDGGVFSYQVPELFALQPGQHNFTVEVSGQTARWNFTVDPNANQAPPGGVSLGVVVAAIAAAVGLAVVAGAGTLVYLAKARGLTPRKILARYPIQRSVLVLHLPLATGGLLVLGALAWRVAADPPIRFATEYILLCGGALAVLPFTIDTLRGRSARRAREQAFAQLLFELADSMRGGIDPIKAIQEMSESETGVLHKPLRLAADQIRIGRPFDEVMARLAESTASPLVERYSTLVAEAARAGGDVSFVVQRAAKDLDDLVKIDLERVRQLRGPTMTMYIAFGVLFMLVAMLVDFAPRIGDIDLASFGLDSDQGVRDVPRLPIATLEQKFFHLLLVSGLGSGLLVGSFTEGQLRFGILHALIMLGLAGIGFPLFVL